MRVWVMNDGEPTDITEGVKTLYDLVLGSMDWGSGFWTYEDALPVAEVGRACGFDQIEEVERYLRARKDWETEHPPPKPLTEAQIKVQQEAYERELARLNAHLSEYRPTEGRREYEAGHPKVHVDGVCRCEEG